MRHILFLVALAMAGRMVGQQPGMLDLGYSDDGVVELPQMLLGGLTMCSNLELIVVDEEDLTQYFVTYRDTLIRFVIIDEQGNVDQASLTPITAQQVGGFFQLTNVLFRRVFPIDGSVYVLLSSDNGLHMLQMGRDGQLDLAFGGGGMIDLSWERFNEQDYQGLMKLQDGGFIVWGGFRSPAPVQDQQNAYLMRLDHLLVPDSAFGNDAAIVLMGSTLSNHPYPTIKGVYELPDYSIAVALYYNDYGPAVFGSASCRIYASNGIYQSSNQLSNWIAACHMTDDGTLLFAFGFSPAHMLKIIRTDGQLSNIQLNWEYIRKIRSDAQGMLYTVANSSIIQKRTPAGLVDTDFGILYQAEDVETTGAESPVENRVVRGMNVLPDGKLLSWGNTTNGSSVLVTRHHNIPDPRSKLSLRVMLGGAFDPGTDLMRDDLRQQGLLPTLQPYTAPAYNAVNGVGSWAMPQEVMSWSGDSAVVDWVWLELLHSLDSTTVAATRAGLVHRNGQVTQVDGRSAIDFSAGAGSYLLRVRHRNHLSVTTATPITLGAGVTSLDLTNPAAATFGTDAQQEVNGVRMLWPGDATGDGVVKYVGAANDRDAILMAIGGSTPTATLSSYHPADLNLDGVVKYVGPSNDRDLILQTIGGSVPTAVRVAQYP